MRNFLIIVHLLLPILSLAQNNFELAYQHNGRYDFTMIGATLNARENPVADCNLDLSSAPSAALNLDPDQHIIAAYLYWSANSQRLNADEQVTLNGTRIYAERVFTTRLLNSNFFGCVADITPMVQSIGNGNYTLTDLSLYRPLGDQNCSTSYGGWSIIIVYEDSNLTPNTVNIFDGFQGVSSSNNSMTIQVRDLLVAQKLGSYIGLLAWEGDSQIAVGETVFFNDNVLSNSVNPSTNLFNGSNSFTNSLNLYNMDLDRFDISEYVDIGDQTAEFRVESHQDMAIMNALAFTLYSELPEPTVTINTANTNCFTNQIEIDFTANNFNANAPLPAGALIKLFLNDLSSDPVEELFTTTEIPIDGSENLTTTINLPSVSTDSIVIIAQINLDDSGSPIILELNSANNSHEVTIESPNYPREPFSDITECELNPNESLFDLDEAITQFEITHSHLTASIHESLNDAENNTGALNGQYVNTANPQTLYVREFNTLTGCVGYVEFQLHVVENPDANPATLEVCSTSNVGQFSLSNANALVNNSSDVAISYHETFLDAENDLANLSDTYQSPSTTIYARVEDTTTHCYSISEITLTVFQEPVFSTITDEILCDDDDDGTMIFDLNSKRTELLNGLDSNSFSLMFFLSQSDADNRTNHINNISSFENITNPQQVFVRLENNAKTDCYRTTSFLITVEEKPEVNDVPISVPTCSTSNTALFDLSIIAIDVAAGNTTMQVNFYSTERDAETASNEILNTRDYSSSSGIVYGRVNNPNTGCFSIGEINLQVLNNPLQINQQLTACATNAANTTAQFNIDQFTDELIGTAQNVTITYHQTFEDANVSTSGGQNAIINADNYTSATGIVYARSEANYNGNICHTVSEIALNVNERPIELDVDMIRCSDTNEATFDLQTEINNRLPNSANNTIAFYRTREAAENDDHAELINEIITTPNTTVYARVVNNISGCFSISTLHLIVEPVPQINSLQLESCRINNVATFNLDDVINQLLTQHPNYTFSVYRTKTDAETETNRLQGTLSSNGETIYIRTENPLTGCFSISDLELTITPTPVDDRGRVVICLSEGFTLPNGQQVFDTGIYEVLIQDLTSGCDINTITDLIVGEISFPTAFSPNGNGVNDRFKAIPGEECVGNISDYELKIYNRWGEKVFETRDFTHGWDGMFNNEKAQHGIYLFRAQYTFQGESVIKTGSISVLY